MKYIKQYESSDMIYKNTFWEIKTADPEFTISLQKIGLTEEEVENFKRPPNINNIQKYPKIYVIYHTPPGRFIGRWVYSYKKFDDSDFKNLKMKTVKFTAKDIERFNIEVDANKYNL